MLTLFILSYMYIYMYVYIYACGIFLKRNGGVWQPNQLIKNMIDKKVWEHLTLVPILRNISILLQYFRKHVLPFFTPNQTILVSVEGRTIELDFCLRACVIERLKFSSRLETSQPETNCRSYSLSQATEKTFGFLDNASKINVIFGYLVFNFSKLIFSE